MGHDLGGSLTVALIRSFRSFSITRGNFDRRGIRLRGIFLSGAAGNAAMEDNVKNHADALICSVSEKCCYVVGRHETRSGLHLCAPAQGAYSACLAKERFGMED
ncbi:hypothetical protein [Lachnoclostridium sp. Marseille-P6806]|uniref:hypothetical protein n=1 Tax=Lachnoclostridium sp. Marseille-P6806 TaxID=2364793 RepID=UPI00103250AF|nr:hypothetical protein [Lachnoclostridium sp. Marseille-P6806]